MTKDDDRTECLRVRTPPDPDRTGPIERLEGTQGVDGI